MPEVFEATVSKPPQSKDWYVESILGGFFRATLYSGCYEALQQGLREKADVIQITVERT